MKRVGRILHRLLTALSLLLLLACAGVWVRSYWVSEQLYWYDWPRDRSFLDDKSIWCSRGGIQFECGRYVYGDIYLARDAHFQHFRDPAIRYAAYGDELAMMFAPTPRHCAALGFEWIPRNTTQWALAVNHNVTIQSLTLPLYFPCLLFALLPAHYLLLLLRRRRIARRLAQGLCPSCGYDLRATLGRCPECGREESALPGSREVIWKPVSPHKRSDQVSRIDK